MAKFYVLGNYTAKAFQGFIANPDTDRGAAIRGLMSALGGKVLDYNILRGSYDFIVVVEAPSFEVGAAAKLATEASGAVTNLTILEPLNINSVAKTAAKAAAGKLIPYFEPFLRKDTLEKSNVFYDEDNPDTYFEEV